MMTCKHVHGRDPNDWKLIYRIWQGVRKIRIRDEAGKLRMIFVTKFGNMLHSLHCFQKKIQATSKPDGDLTAKRYLEVVKELNL